MKNNPVPFDESAIGDSLVLTVNDTILQTSVAATPHRMARSLYGQTTGAASGASTVEFYVYSPNFSDGTITVAPSIVPVSHVPPVCVGLVNTSADLAKFVGEDANGWCLCSDGTVINNGSVVATFASGFALNDYVGMTLDKVNNAVTFSVNGTVLGTVTGLATDHYYYAATVSGNPGDLAVWANAGQTPLRFPTGQFWFHIAIGLDPLFLATEPYTAANADATPNQKFTGAVNRITSPTTINRGVVFWPWGASMPPSLQRGGQIQVQIDDPNEIYGELMSLDIRDQILEISLLFQGDALSTATPILTAVIDHCEQPTDQTKVLYCNDKLVQAQSQLVRAMFAPNADSSVAGKPRPYSVGVCRTYVPPMFDSVNWYLGAGDEAFSAVGKWRAQGVEMAYTIDFTIMADGQSFSLPAAPTGKITAETTTFGGAFDPSQADLLSGDGEFGSTVADGGGITATSTSSVAIGTGSKSFNVGAGKSFATSSPVTVTSTGSGATMTGTVSGYSGATLILNIASVTGSGTHTDWSVAGGVNQAHDWICSGGYAGTSPATDVFQIKGTSPNKYVEQSQVADGVFWMKHATLTIAPGQSIAYEVIVKQSPYYGNAVDALGNPAQIPPAILAFAGIASQSLPFYCWTRFPVPSAGTYRGTFTNNQSVSLPLVFGNLCNSFIQGSGGTTSLLQIDDIILVALPSLTQNVQLQGETLDGMLKDLLVTHGPFELSDYDSSGAQAIDAATGYQYGLHVSENDTPQVDACCRKILDSVCADYYVNRSGQISVVQLTDPEDVDDADVDFDMDENDFTGYLQPWPDNAENLTTRMSGCPQADPYTESDFANVSQSDVPQSVRKVLQQPSQWTVTANAVLSPKYQSAMNAQPLASQLDRQADGQAEISRVAGFYKLSKGFYEGPINVKGRVFDIGMTGFVKYSAIPALATKRKLKIVGIQEQPSEGAMTLVFWGGANVLV